jgi:thiol-disulfide isomerase/thioredoxin
MVEYVTCKKCGGRYPDFLKTSCPHCRAEKEITDLLKKDFDKVVEATAKEHKGK